MTQPSASEETTFKLDTQLTDVAALLAGQGRFTERDWVLNAARSLVNLRQELAALRASGGVSSTGASWASGRLRCCHCGEVKTYENRHNAGPAVVHGHFYAEILNHV